MKFCQAVLTIVLSSVSASAQDGYLITEAPAQNEIVKNSSRYHRLDKKVTANLGLLGVSPGFAAGNNLSVGYHISPNQVFLIEASAGQSTFKRMNSSSTLADSKSNESDIRINAIGGHYKHFLGNSFYVRGGIDYHQVKYSYDYDIAGSNSFDYQSEFEGSALIGSAMIGNQWQWDNFTLGCDWFGLAQGFASRVTSENFSGFQDQKGKQDFEDDKKLFLNGGSFALLRFYLGASF